MALYRKQGSKIYYCKFDFKGKEIRRSTGATNKKDALTIQSTIRAELAKGHWGILEEKVPEITLEEFLKNHFVTGEIRGKTQQYYKYGVDKLIESDMAKLQLHKITPQDVQRYKKKHVRPGSDFKPEARAKHLENGKLSPSSVNCVLRTLRRALGIAKESKYLPEIPKVELAKNERHRERVISKNEQEVYLEKLSQPCKDVALLMLNLGMRPGEVYAMRWEDINLVSRLVDIPDGKTKNAKRDLPLMADAYEVLHGRLRKQGEPKEGWIFPAPTKSGHINESSIKHQHRAAIESAGINYFELYCLRHTFLTILGSSGCDPYTLCRIAGHGDIQMGMRYCHPQREFTQIAFDRMVQFRQEGVTKGGYHAEPEKGKSLSPSVTQSTTIL